MFYGIRMGGEQLETHASSLTISRYTRCKSDLTKSDSLVRRRDTNYPTLTLVLLAMDYKSFPCNGACVRCRVSAGSSVVSRSSMEEHAVKHEAMSTACFCFDL